MAIRATAASAVDRNRLRRRTREIVRAFDPAPGNDVVVAATREAAGKNFQDLSSALVTALEKAGVGRRQ